jgi:surface protein
MAGTDKNLAWRQQALGEQSTAANFGLGVNAQNFNQNLNSWNTSKVTTMESMFENCLAFNQNISNWDISKVTNFSGFMNGKTASDYSSANLNAIYNTWSTLSVQPNLTNVDFGTIKYTLAGQAGKNILTNAPNNWQIIDGGI